MSSSQPSGPFPVPNATIPFWRTELHELDSHRSTAELPEKQDIAIIGAGFAGAAAAYYLLKDSDDANPSQRPSITILEAREACSGASGRNGGHIRPDPYLALARRIATLGLATANEIAAFEYANLDAVVDLIGAEGIACELQPRVDSGDAYVDADQAAAIQAQYEELRRLGVCPTVTWHGTPEDAERVSGIKGARGAATFKAATVWPYKFIMGLLEICVNKGANLQTHTPVLSISDAPDAEGYWALTTSSRGPTRAKQVLFATNGYTGGVLPAYRDVIVPTRGVVARVLVPDPTTSKQLPLGSCAPRWAPRLHDYYGVRAADGSLLVGGAWRRLRGDRGKREEYVNIWDDASLIPATEGYFDGWAENTFKGWEGVETKVDRVWSGIMGDTLDDLPHIGQVPSKPGQFICAGFNGHGMPNVLLCAKGVAKVMKEGSAFVETGVPACYETTAGRLQARVGEIS